MKDFEPAYGVANAVLYEGYLLFPYTASTAKNRVRWQFGVVVPEKYLAAQTGEHAEQQTDVLFTHDGAPDIDVLLRFLQVEARTVEVYRGGGFEPAASFTHAGQTYVSFDEAVERELLVNVRPDGALRHVAALDFAGGRDVDELRDDGGAIVARIVRERWPVSGALTIEVEPAGVADPPVGKLRARVANCSEVVPGERSAALRTSLVSTHILLAIAGGAFLSVLDPPPFAAAATAQLANRQTFPVLIGAAGTDEQRAPLVLSSPIILYDFPALGAQTEADAFDATEIDELLTLSVLSLSDDERAEARVTDPRARAIVERAERFGPAAIARLHAGALHRIEGSSVSGAPSAAVPWPGNASAAPSVTPMSPSIAAFERLADPFAEAGAPAGLAGDPLLQLDVPKIDCVFVAGTKVTRGSSVRLHPRARADIWDSLIDGKVATVRAIHQDFEDRQYVAVTVDDDPASDLHDWYGRAFFFSPDEVEPLAAEAGA